MFKKFKYLNTLCVIMIFSILALALAIGFIAVSALKDESAEDDPLNGFKGEYQVETSTSSESDESSGSDTENTDDSGSGEITESDEGDDTDESTESDESDEDTESDESTESEELPENLFEEEEDFWNKEVKPYSIYADRKLDNIYLRVKSYGDYDGRNWSEAVAYTELMDGIYPASFLSSK